MNKNTGKFIFFFTLTLLTSCSTKDKTQPEVVKEKKPLVIYQQRPVQVEQKNDEGDIWYTSNGGETLMNVSFRMYSDYKKWKDIKSENKELLKGVYIFPAGLKIKLPAPINPYNPPAGWRPYKVMDNEYLGDISMKLYGTSKLWPLLYKHNKGQMPSPDEIFSGSVIFYPENPDELKVQ